MRFAAAPSAPTRTVRMNSTECLSAIGSTGPLATASRHPDSFPGLADKLRKRHKECPFVNQLVGIAGLPY
jgi:hypothetical protein